MRRRRRRGEINRREGERELSPEREAMEKPKERAPLKKELLSRRAREAREKPLDRGEPLLERGSPQGREIRSHGEERREGRRAPRAWPPLRLEPQERAAQKRRGEPRGDQRRERPLSLRRRRSEARRDQKRGAHGLPWREKRRSEGEGRLKASP